MALTRSLLRAYVSILRLLLNRKFNHSSPAYYNNHMTYAMRALNLIKFSIP
jgi:hypothetical protein